MPALVDRQRQLARDAYGEFCIQNLERLGAADSEYVRLNALKQLARIVGIVSLLPQIHDLAANTRSEWISFQATIIIANYLQLFSDAAADNRPEPLTLDLAEQLAVQQQLEEQRANLTPVDPNDLAYYHSALSDPPQPTQQLPADAANEADDASDEEADADQTATDAAPVSQPEQPADNAATDQPTADAATDQPAADAAPARQPAVAAPDSDQPEQPADNADADQPTEQPPTTDHAAGALNAEQPEAIERLFQQAEQLIDRLASQPDPDLNLDLEPPT